MRKVLSLLLLFSLAFSMASGSSIASADSWVTLADPHAVRLLGPSSGSSSDNGMVMGCSALQSYAGRADAQIVWFAGEGWYVIGYDGTGNSTITRDGVMTLFHGGINEESLVREDPDRTDANAYSGSTLESHINSWLCNGSAAKFTSAEQCAIVPRILDGDSGNYGSDTYHSNNIKGESVTALLWPLSAAEASELPTSIAASSNSIWWLRSPGADDSCMQVVNGDGSVSFLGSSVDSEHGIRPAFDLDFSTVLFMSPAENGKTSGTGADALRPTGSPSGEWKLTLLDNGSVPGLSGHRYFTVESVSSCDGKNLYIKYTGAATGGREYISAIIRDSAGYIKYYGRIADSYGFGTVVLNIDGKLSGDDMLYVFNERYNGDRLTDYASDLQRIYIPGIVGHSWKDATCTEPKTCTVCGATEGEALGHSWQEATCTEPKICTVCGETGGKALGHDWIGGSCTEPRTCSRCGLEEGSVPGHTWQDATCTAPKTCTVCGITEGDALGHNWKEATCTEPKTCSVCYATDGKPLGHNWKEATCTEPKTCVACGATEGEPAGHKWKINTCTEPRTCEVCGLTEGSAPGHTWQDATCTQPKTCKVCGTTEGGALGHSWKNATCTDPKTCERCMATEGKALGHTKGEPVKENEKKATCDTKGSYDNVVYCTVCGVEISRQTKTTEATGHIWDEGKVTQEPDCEHNGSKTYTCKNDSSHTRTEVLKATGHKWNEGTVTVKPTCEEKGQRTYTCINNKNHILIEEIKPLGHDWGEWKITKEAGIDKEGEREHTCKVCGKTEKESIKPLNSCSVTFDTNGGTKIASQIVAKGQYAHRPVDPEKDGYTFTGWYADSACRTRFDFTYAVSSDIVVYAGWKENEKPAPTTYAVTKGASGIWTKGSNEPYTIVIKTGAEEDTSFDHYLETLIDGERVLVTTQPGSTVIQIAPETLEKLTRGAHTITVVFDDGTATALLSIADESGTPEQDDDKNSGVPLSPWMAIIPVALLGVAAGFLFGRKSRKRA